MTAVPPASVSEALDSAAPAVTSNGEGPSGGGSKSGLRRTLWVELTDGRQFTVTTAVADALLYERSYKKPLFDSMGVTQMVFMAWAALKRTGQVKVKFGEFEPLVADFEDVTDDEEGNEADPTRSAL